MALLLLLLVGLAVPGVAVAARLLEARHWAASLRAYRLVPPASLTAQEVTRWLANVSATTHPAAWSLLPLPPVQFHVSATRGNVSFYLLVAKSAEAKMLHGLRATLPGMRIEAAPDYLTHRPAYQVAAEGRLTNMARPLSVDRADSTSAGLLAALGAVPAGCTATLTWTFTGAGTPRPVRTTPPADDWTPFLIESEAPSDADAVRALRAKRALPLLHAVPRLAVAAPDVALARRLFGNIWPQLHGANSPGVRFVRRWLPSKLVAERLRTHAVPALAWPMTLNAAELATLLGLPVGGIHLPGLRLGAARQLPPAPQMATHGQIIGVSNYAGSQGRPVALKTVDRLRHQYIVGPTGSGKSVLIARMVVQDFTRGYGCAVFDPKADLIPDILARLPEERLDDVIVLDASDRVRPIGFNVLGSVGSETERELTVDNVLHIFRSIWADFWGPRSDAILRAGLNTLALARAADGSKYTLCELPHLLASAGFRSALVGRTALPDSLRDFWHRFASLSTGEQTQSILPLLTKLDAFVQRTPIALMLGQAGGIDLHEVFTRRKLLLVNLAKGALGSETSNLLGSLLVSSLIQATHARVSVPPELRRPCFAYIDEAQDIMRLPVPLADVLSQARGLGLGVVMANQYVAQLPAAMQAAILGTVRSTMAFAVDYTDARTLEKRFAPLTADDLQGLDRYEAAARCCVDGQTLPPVTLTTLPPGPVLRDPAELAARSRARYGTDRAAVEAAMRQRLTLTDDGSGGFGRVTRQGGSR